MNLSERKHATAGIAAFTAGIVTMSVVSVPPKIDTAIIHRAEVRAVQLSAIAASDLSTALANTAATLAVALISPSVPPAAAATGPSARALIHPAAPTTQAANATTAAGKVDWAQLAWEVNNFLRNAGQRVFGLVIGLPVIVTFLVGLAVTVAVANVAEAISEIPIVAKHWPCFPRKCQTVAQADTATAATVAVPKSVAGSAIRKAIAAIAALPTKKTSTPARGCPSR